MWHHAGFLVASVDELETVRAGLTDTGHPVALSGRNPGVARFFYVDARATLGHHLEYFALEDPGAARRWAGRAVRDPAGQGFPSR